MLLLRSISAVLLSGLNGTSKTDAADCITTVLSGEFKEEKLSVFLRITWVYIVLKRCNTEKSMFRITKTKRDFAYDYGDEKTDI